MSLGTFTKHEILKKSPTGYFIEIAAGTAFLPFEEVDTELNVGDEIEAFIYHDYDGHLTATTKKPFMQVGEYDILRIKAAGDMGAFADWGLPKDLFIPHAEQYEKVKQAEWHLIHAYVDEKSGRITGSTRIDRFASDIVEKEQYEAGAEVELIVFMKTDLGYKALIDNAYTGVLYENELTQPVEPGMKLKGFVKTIREDGKIDLTLRKAGYDEVLTASDVILKLLIEKGGKLPYHDKSDPEIIKKDLHMSKRTFKAAIGGLFKSKKIILDSDGIQLSEHTDIM